ncbi:unnamed protein product [Ranitomeya imitator]|uniref:ribonuclease H n=1 Tax=Ranitomeya imitator TaxID=111125 RepID=A0ABN9L1U2_9NEOB|nr:unnamed protein product [Ranitomeya imitator]
MVTVVMISCRLDAQPTESEKDIYNQVNVVLKDAEGILDDLQSYRGAGLEIREAIQHATDEKLQEKAWGAVVPLVGKLKKFYEFSQRLEAALRGLLGALTSTPYSPTQHLEREQALAKQFAEILHFTLRFDELKMTNPAIQNDFSYYRRTLSRMRINNVPAEGENEVNNELANRMSLFYAEATPMLKTLSDATTKFVSENKNLPIENTTDCLSTMASVCRVMLETPEYRSRFTNEETVSFCLRVMVGVIILYDHVHPVGAFAKMSKIDVCLFSLNIKERRVLARIRKCISTAGPRAGERASSFPNRGPRRPSNASLTFAFGPFVPAQPGPILPVFQDRTEPLAQTETLVPPSGLFLPGAGNRDNPDPEGPDLPDSRLNDSGTTPVDTFRVGGRLLLFQQAWLSVVHDEWVRDLVSSGYKIEFSSPPPTRFFPSRLPSSAAQSRALLCAIHTLRQSGVIVPVPEHERFKGFYSNLFVVPKKDGKVRPILDLKLLNKCVRVRHFRMESLRSVISSMERGEFLASIDIKDAYLHIPIFPPHQRFLRFAIREDHFQFTALPFGLATAPRVFTKGKSFLPIRWLVVTTDASLLGWGAVFLHHSAQGRWTVRESKLPINILEIRAIRLALSRFHALLAGHPVRVQSDNVTAVAYINHQGGTRSRAAMQEVSLILRWAETNHSIISAVHIPGVENWAADFLSRQGLVSGEWELHPEVFHQICLRWGTPDVDLMASRLNAKVHNLIARSRDPQAIGVDALISPWHQFQLPYVFPPLPLLPKVIRKIKTEGVPVILVAPDWPRRAWYAELVQLVADVPLRLPDRPDLLRQGPIYHQSSGALRLTAWLLKPGF